MKLQNINHLIQKFKSFLKEQKDFPVAYKWECLNNFQQNWDLEVSDFAGMYDSSIQSNLSRSLWKGTNYTPKEHMLRFIKLDSDLVRHMFTDLFDESKSIDGRTGRFVFYCDQLMEEYKRQHPASIDNNHDHGDYRMVSLYLGFRFPEKYCLYNFEDFCTFLKLVDSNKIPTSHDLDRFFKLSRTVSGLMDKDEGLQALFLQKTRGASFYGSPSLLWVHYLFECCRLSFLNKIQL